MPGEIYEDCKYFSKFTGTCVAFVNDKSPGDYSNVFIGGAAQIRRLGNEVIHYYSIGLNLIRVKRTAILKKLPPFNLTEIQ